jgi:LytR cell envelope-related transcriptional attenuator
MTSRVPTPPNRRRFDRVGGSVLAVIGVVVAVVAIIALQHPNGRQAKPVSLKTSTVTATATQTTTKSPPASRTSTRTAPPPSHTGGSSTSTSSSHSIPLVVLNSTTIQGLAETAKQQFEAGGWTVTSTDNIVNDIISTCAYYDPSDPANEQAAMQLQQQFPSIKRVKEKFSELPAGPIVVVLTSDYS